MRLGHGGQHQPLVNIMNLCITWRPVARFADGGNEAVKNFNVHHPAIGQTGVGDDGAWTHDQPVSCGNTSSPNRCSCSSTLL